ncbi:MAG: YHYH protein [Burkholderiaceae bacterium]|nr:YHYH protein [Burkholderiaceae bacterium]MDO9089786.1 YHYH protein [Burkholderiaceae bacterium]
MNLSVPATLQRLGLMGLLALVLAACGANADTPSSAAQSPQAARAPTATDLLDWAEATYPDLFPGHPANQIWAPYTYRYYESGATKNYLGVTTDGHVYAMGTLVDGGGLAYVAPLSSFACRIFPADCATTVPGTTTVAVGSGGSTAAVLCDYSASLLNSVLNLMSTSAIACTGSQRTFTGTGVPDHAPGTFPNANNPTAISSQNVRFTTTVNPAVITTGSVAVDHILGYAKNSVKFDPSTAESYQNQGIWKIEALNQTYFRFGTDSSNAHVQPNGAYHYHGMPEGLITLQNKGTGMTLVGFAVDGFPIYARYGYTVAGNAASGTKVMSSSWRLKTTPSTGRPATSTVAMGTFTQDYEYVAGLGDLDECNGRVGVTPEFPSGIYHYYITDSFPYIQRCVKGTAASTTGG